MSELDIRFRNLDCDNRTINIKLKHNHFELQRLHKIITSLALFNVIILMVLAIFATWIMIQT